MAQNNNNKNKQKTIMNGYSSPQTPYITTNQPTESQKQNAEKKN